MTDPAENRRNVVALSTEQEATASLLRQGFKIMDEYKFALTDAEPLFVCWAGGAEKLLKLTIGAAGIEYGGAWPALSVMQYTYGHDIVSLNKSVMDLIEQHKARSTVPGHVDQLQMFVAGDTALAGLLGALSRYAIRGRFYNLDHLAGSEQLERSPREMLETDVHQLFTAAHPALLTDLDTLRPKLNRLIAESFASWCHLIVRCWITGVFGDLAKQWGHGFRYRP